MKRVDILGLHVHACERAELVSQLAQWAISTARPARRMYYTNAHVFNLAHRDAWFRDELNRADLLICEGYGGRLAARIAGVRPVPAQHATMDWMDDFLAVLAASGASIYLLGDEPGVAAACGATMASRHQGLRLAGAHHGFFDHDEESDAIVADINASRPAVLLVGMGNPRQERWIADNLARLDASLVLALGAMFRWYAEVEPRAPFWMRRMHLEWLLRLLRHPVRHFRRYVIGNPALIVRALVERLQHARSMPPG